MSWGTCYAGSNNIHFGFPPIMTDGRNYAQWQPGAVVNKTLREEAGIKSNWQYRKYLQQNADQIIEYDQRQACGECCGCPYYKSNPSANNPYLFTSCTEQTQPFGYEGSDLKNIYLNRHELQCRMSVPDLSQFQLLQKPNAN